MIFQENATIEDKLRILADAAKYDVACTSSGVDRAGQSGSIGNSLAGGICHSFSSDGRCISLLKVLFSNECVFDCKYCCNRCSNDVLRASFTPEELCTLTIEFYRRNYIEGLFLSSGVINSPNYTMEQIIISLRMLREQHHFNGYIHCKAVPGADPCLIEAAGWYADRMSVNLELPTVEGLKTLAPHKTRGTILGPIRQIQNGIAQSQNELGMMGGNHSAYWHTKKNMQNSNSKFLDGRSNTKNILNSQKTANGKTEVSGFLTMKEDDEPDVLGNTAGGVSFGNGIIVPRTAKLSDRYTGHSLSMIDAFGTKRGFVAAGQSTQMIVGATPENDFQMISVAEALYEKFDLKRVFYSAFINVNKDSSLPCLPGGPPLLREHRLYQADWLLRYYGFKANEILSEKQPNFNIYMDPKCNWAIGHLEDFPVEVNTADYFTLMRVPGIGAKSANRIVNARKTARLRFEDLKRIGVVLKRALYFITCGGRMMYPVKLDEDFITRQLMGVEEPLVIKNFGESITYRQLSLFDDVNFSVQA